MKTACLIATFFIFASGYAVRANALFNDLGSPLNGFGPVVSGFPYGNSFATGASPFELSSVTVALEQCCYETPPPEDLTISAVLLSDSSNAPGAVLETIGTLNEDTVSTPGPPSFPPLDYTINGSPYALAPDTRYWIELTSNDTSQYGYVEWGITYNVSGAGTAGQYYSADDGDIVLPDTDAALLIGVPGTIASSTPEPSTFAAVCTAIAVLGFRKHGSSRRRNR